MTRRAFGQRDEGWYLALASAIFIHVFIVVISVAVNFFWKRTLTVPMVQNVTLFDVASLPQAQKGQTLEQKSEEGGAVKERPAEQPVPPKPEPKKRGQPSTSTKTRAQARTTQAGATQACSQARTQTRAQTGTAKTCAQRRGVFGPQA